MTRLIDQTYLKEKQYKTDANLRARIDLHRRFNTNPENWQRWVYDQLSVEEGLHILEIGCGPGDLWKTNLDRLPERCQVIAADLSAGMVDKARSVISEQPGSRFLVLDAQTIPFSSGVFDRVVANHMLYHVPDLAAATGEIRRVLKPGGRLFAATNGIKHMRELDELIAMFHPGYQSVMGAAMRFSLENAPQILEPDFRDIEVREFESNLMVTDTEPLLAYVESMASSEGMDLSGRESLKNYVQTSIDQRGSFWISKSQGIVVGTKR